MSTREEDYRAIDERGEVDRGERGYARETVSEYGRTGGGDNVDEGDDLDDSVLVFEFLKRKRPLPSARRLDLMLSVSSILSSS